MTLTKNDLDQIRGIVNESTVEIRADLAVIKEDIADLKEVTAKLQAEVFDLQQNMAHVLTTLNSLRADVNRLTLRMDDQVSRHKQLGVRADKDVRAAYIDVEKLSKRVTALEKIYKELKATHAKA